jgi:hypothetical protein
MRYYCTLCDSTYLVRGLVLYESLLKHSREPFQFFVLAMDPDVVERLRSVQGLDTSPIRMVDLQGLEYFTGLGAIRQSRTWQEYCWSAASNLCDFLMGHHHLEGITYIDADMMFFSDPAPVFNEIGTRSIAVIPHRFIPEKQYLSVNGQFNVSWVTFRDTPVGRECLSRWAKQCRTKCSLTDGCGDQKYLDEWPALYGDELCVIQNPGAGLAPWNLANYRITEGPQVNGQPCVFYHYHETKANDDGTFYLTGYALRDEDRRIIYEPYIERLRSAMDQIRAARDGGDYRESGKESSAAETIL